VALEFSEPEHIRAVHVAYRTQATETNSIDRPSSTIPSRDYNTSHILSHALGLWPLLFIRTFLLQITW